jgi:hypothetical protein
MREIAKVRNVVVLPASDPTYKPTESEWAAIHKGEAEIARGESVSLTDLVHELDRNRRKGGRKTTRKLSR